MVKGSFFSLKKSEAGEKKLLTWGPIRERLRIIGMAFCVGKKAKLITGF